jgi:hypothetical protein
MPVQISTLQSIPLRDAWTHEARDFTPWLAEKQKVFAAFEQLDIRG